MGINLSDFRELKPKITLRHEIGGILPFVGIPDFEMSSETQFIHQLFPHVSINNKPKNSLLKEFLRQTSYLDRNPS